MASTEYVKGVERLFRTGVHMHVTCWCDMARGGKWACLCQSDNKCRHNGQNTVREVHYFTSVSSLMYCGVGLSTEHLHFTGFMLIWAASLHNLWGTDAAQACMNRQGLTPTRTADIRTFRHHTGTRREVLTGRGCTWVQQSRSWWCVWGYSHSAPCKDRHANMYQLFINILPPNLLRLKT